MLQKIRDHAHGWWTWVLVPLLIVLFAFWGIGNYLGGGLSQNEIAKVNSETISATSFAQMVQSMNNSQNPNQNPSTTQSIKIQVLETLVDKLLLSQSLKKLGFSASDDALNQVIYHIPVFQQNGQFSMSLYQAFLQNIGQTTESLKADLQEGYLINQFQQGLLLSEFALPGEITAETQYANMQRDVKYAIVAVNQFAPKIAPTPDQIQAYYTTHQNNFLTPLQVKLAYVTLSESQFPNAAAYSAALSEASNLAFQNAGSLDSIAQAFKVPVQTTAMLDTSHPSNLLSNTSVLQAVTSGSVLTQGNNSSAISLSPTQSVVVRVLASVAPTPEPLSAVQAQIISQIESDAAEQTALTTFHSLVNAINQGGNLSQLATAYGLTTQTATGITANNIAPLPAAAVGPVLKLGVNQGVLVPLSNNTFMIAEVLKIYANPAGETSHPASPQSIQKEWAQIEMGQYLNHEQATAKVNINQALFKAS